MKKSLIVFSLLMFSEWLVAEQEFYPFDAQFGSGLSSLLAFPECDYGDHLCRRWGVAAEIPVPHRPAGSIDKKYLEKLDKSGVNFIRFNSIESKRNKIFIPWFEGDKRLLETQLSLLDEMIPLLKNKNMQYALSANDDSYKAKFYGAKANKEKIEHKQFKSAQLTNQKAIQGAAEWLTWFYSRPVKGESYNYGDDPGNRYVTLVGEDSAYYGFFKDNGNKLDDATRNKLAECFNGDSWSVFDGLPKSWRLKKDAAGSVRMGECLSRMEQNYYSHLLTPTLNKILPSRRATSNSWYGLGYLRKSNKIGNIVDAHAYYDHVVYLSINGSRVEAVRNRSIIAEPGIDQHGQKNLVRANLLSLFASSVADKELYVSEWSHPFWSDYAYEGPLLTVAYASFQNYPLLITHTLMAWNDDKSKRISQHGFSAHGNQVFQVMNPTLALAYRRGDIASAQAASPIRANSTDMLFEQEMFSAAMDPSRLASSPELGLERHYRLAFDTLSASAAPVSDKSHNTISSNTGEINWRFKDRETASLVIDTARFKAVAGSLQRANEAAAMQVTADTHGVVMAISGNDQPIAASASILLTAVSSQKGMNMKIDQVAKKGFEYPLKAVLHPGDDSVLLKKIRANIALNAMTGKTYSLYSVDASGNRQFVKKISAVAGRVELTVGDHDTPWYLLIRSDI